MKIKYLHTKLERNVKGIKMADQMCFMYIQMWRKTVCTFLFTTQTERITCGILSTALPLVMMMIG